MKILLWCQSFTIENGSVKFYENPELCYEDLERFVAHINQDRVSLSFNGYRRLTCSNRTIDLNVRAEKNRIKLGWLVQVSDLRRLKGYTVAYTEVGDEFEFDKRDIDLEQEEQSARSGYEWSYQYVSFDETVYKRNGLIEAQLECEPFTRYALYVKADLMLDYSWYSGNGSAKVAFENDRLVSQINYVYSLPARN